LIFKLYFTMFKVPTYELLINISEFEIQYLRGTKRNFVKLDTRKRERINMQ